jgi:CAAX protease family protein
LDRTRMAGGGAVVLVSMAALFSLPAGYFVALTFVSTSCMVGAAVIQGGFKGLFSPSAKKVALGLAAAVVLYLVFLGGNAAVRALHPLGITTSAESSIYSLIASPRNPPYLQVSVLLFDAVGFESYFRGVLQTAVEPRLGRSAPFAVAAADALVHLISLNILWVVATFLVDSVWGAVFLRTRDLTSSMASHFVWDVAIFILFPVV